MTIDDTLLAVLACPACKTKVELADDSVVCVQCHRKFPVRDGIPIMLLNEASGGPDASDAAEK